MAYYTSFLPVIESSARCRRMLAAPESYRFYQYQEFGDYAKKPSNCLGTPVFKDS
jgi:hypothetical protein